MEQQKGVMMIIYGVYEKFVGGWAGDTEEWELFTLHTTEDLALDAMHRLVLADVGLNYKYKVEEVFVNE